MQDNEYTAQCDKCRKRTWHTIEQPCTMSYPQRKVCNLGHTHEYSEKMEKCTGTLRLIDYTNVRTHLTIGARYTFRDKEGNVKRFTLGRTNGWRPCLLLMHNARSTGSSITVNAPDLKYKDGAYETNTYFI